MNKWKRPKSSACACIRKRRPQIYTPRPCCQPVDLSILPLSRRDKGFRSARIKAGEDDSENRGFRDLKKYYVSKIRLSSKGCKEEKSKNDSVCFICFFVLFIAVAIDSKLILHHMGKVLIFNLPS